MADAPTPTEAKPGAEQTPAAKVETQAATPKVYDEAYVKSLRDEAKGYREKLESEAAAKAAAEKSKLEAEGNWKALAETERKRADEIAGKATERDVFAKELDELKALELAGLPDDIRAYVADLSPAKAIALARKLNAKNAGPGAAPVVNGGAPQSPKAPVDLSRMSDSQQREYLRSNPTARKSLLAGLSANQDPFGGR